jgi:hypothetical protein
MMQTEKIAAIHESSELQLQSGKIESSDDCYRVLAQGRHYSALRAFSCLVEPRVDDVVLFSIDTRKQCHILSIIERPQASDTNLEFPGNVTIGSANGQLNMHANQGINMVSQQDISQVAESYTLVAKKALLSTDEMTVVGSTLVARIKNVRSFADRIETVAGNWLQKLTNSFRYIEGVDQLKARDAIHTVKNLYSMRSRQAAMLAKKDIKIDAERIHMG